MLFLSISFALANPVFLWNLSFRFHHVHQTPDSICHRTDMSVVPGLLLYSQPTRDLQGLHSCTTWGDVKTQVAATATVCSYLQKVAI